MLKDPTTLGALVVLKFAAFLSEVQCLQQLEEAERMQVLQGRRFKSDWTARTASQSMLLSFSCFLFLRDKKQTFQIFLKPSLKQTLMGKPRVIMPVNRKQFT